MFNRDRFLLLLPWCIALVLAGCGQSPAETGTTRTTAESDTYGSYHGLVSIEEQILWDDVVARVRLISVDGAVVVEPGGTYRGAWSSGSVCWSTSRATAAPRSLPLR